MVKTRDKELYPQNISLIPKNHGWIECNKLFIAYVNHDMKMNFTINDEAHESGFILIQVNGALVEQELSNRIIYHVHVNSTSASHDEIDVISSTKRHSIITPELISRVLNFGLCMEKSYDPNLPRD